MDFRKNNGPFRRREQLLEVPGIGEARFVQAAGFLKIGGGENPLDGTWIHPESYAIARQLLTELGYETDRPDGEGARRRAARTIQDARAGRSRQPIANRGSRLSSTSWMLFLAPEETREKICLPPCSRRASSSSRISRPGWN